MAKNVSKSQSTSNPARKRQRKRNANPYVRKQRKKAKPSLPTDKQQDPVVQEQTIIKDCKELNPIKCVYESELERSQRLKREKLNRSTSRMLSIQSSSSPSIPAPTQIRAICQNPVSQCPESMTFTAKPNSGTNKASSKQKTVNILQFQDGTILKKMY